MSLQNLNSKFRMSGIRFLRDFMKKKLYILKVLIMLVASQAVIGCSKQKSHPKYRESLLRVNLPQQPETMDPRKGRDLSSSMLHGLLFEGLTRIGPSASDEKALAYAIDLSDDKTVYTFHLREAVWSNGKPITAHDLEYSWKSMLDSSFPCPNANILYCILNAEEAKKGLLSIDQVGIQSIDDHTLQVKLKAPTPYFLNLTSFCVFFPVSKDIASSHPQWSDTVSDFFVCSGPYKIASWKKNSEILLEKNPNYWNKDNVSLEKICISLIESPNTALEMFEKGELDMIGSPYTPIPQDAIQALSEQNKLIPFPEAKTLFCSFNTTKAPLNNVHIRRALSLSIDREAIVANMGTIGDIPAVNFVPPTLKNGKNDAFIESHNNDAAAEELELGLTELGISLEDLNSLTLIYPNQDGHTKLAQAIQEQWRKNLGITIKLEVVDYNLYLNRVSSYDFDISQFYWVAQYDDPVSILDRFKYRSNPKNYPKWENEEFINLLNASAFAEDAKRVTILDEAEALIMCEMPLAPIFHSYNVRMIQPYVHGLFSSSLGSVHLHQVYFEETETTAKE